MIIKKAIFLLAIIGISSTALPSFAGGIDEPNARPNLFIDGKGLANALTPWLLQTYDSKKITTRRIIKSPLDLRGFMGLKHNLENGYQFATNDRRYAELAPSALEDWLTSQPARSVTPEAFFKKSITLASGNVTDGLVLAWDCLSNYWMDEKGRNNLPFAKALVDITGEHKTFLEYDIPNHNAAVQAHLDATRPDEKIPFLKGRRSINRPKLKAIRGDNYSAWYHFAGTALASFLYANAGTTSRKLQLDKVVTSGMLFAEEHLLYNEFVDPLKRRTIDRAGMNFGATLARNLHSKKVSGPSEVLYENPKVYGPKWALKPGQKPWEYQAPKGRIGKLIDGGRNIILKVIGKK